jgi:hypothetical protein
MTTRNILLFALALVVPPSWPQTRVIHAHAALPAPGFHHLHLNSTNPDKAVEWYVKAFPVNSKVTWGGQPG